MTIGKVALLAALGLLREGMIPAVSTSRLQKKPASGQLPAGNGAGEARSGSNPQLPLQVEAVPFDEGAGLRISGAFQIVQGKVGSMNVEKVVAAIETAARREGLLCGQYRDEHALYHAVLEALYGVCRGQLELGAILRTVGLNFAIVKGPRWENEEKDGQWIAVALYGTIGAPVRGMEHEVIGLGVNHL